jgi:hypothetical protein
VAEDHWTPGAEEVEVTVAVRVVKVSSFGVSEKRRVTAHGSESTHRRIDAAGKEFFGAEL